MAGPLQGNTRGEIIHVAAARETSDKSLFCEEAGVTHLSIYDCQNHFFFTLIILLPGGKIVLCLIAQRVAKVTAS